MEFWREKLLHKNLFNESWISREKKGKERSRSNNLSNKFLAFQRAHMIIDSILEFEPRSVCTSYILKLLLLNTQSTFSASITADFELTVSSLLIISSKKEHFERDFASIIKVADLIMSREKKEKLHKEKSTTTKENQSDDLFIYFKKRIVFLPFLEKQIGIRYSNFQHL